MTITGIFSLSQVIASAVERRDHEECRAAMEKFLEAAERHFTEEEEFLTQTGWPGIEEHKSYHAKLLARAKDLKQVCEEKDKRGENEILYFDLVAFVIDNALRGDYQFKSYLEYHGHAKQNA